MSEGIDHGLEFLVNSSLEACGIAEQEGRRMEVGGYGEGGGVEGFVWEAEARGCECWGVVGWFGGCVCVGGVCEDS